MCNPISWIKRIDGSLLYLTMDNFNSPKMERFINRNPGWYDDITGHGAIRYFYPRCVTWCSQSEVNFIVDDGLRERKASPRDFPAEIAQAMKDGKFKYIFMAPELLTKEAREEYNTQESPVNATFQKKMDPWRNKWYKNAISDKTYYREHSIARLAYHKRTNNIFWKLWADPKNRIKAWR